MPVYPPLDYKYAKRAFVYREEPACFRTLDFTTKSIGESLRKIVDIEGGWLHLQGHDPAVAIRHHAGGRISRTDHRILKRAVGALMNVGFLVLGELDENSVFLPLGTGDYLAIRDWVPSEKGMNRTQTAEYYAQQEARAACYLAQRQAAIPREAASSASALPAGTVDPSRDDLATDSPSTGESSTRYRPCTDRSPSSRNYNGTKLAVYHTIPYHPPISPQGDGRAPVDSIPNPSQQPPPTAAELLAQQAVEWINQQHDPPLHYEAPSAETLRRARGWQKAGWDWPTVQSALQLRLASQKATHPHDWQNWVTPATFLNRRLRHFVEQAKAGHRYRVISGGRAGDDPAQAQQRIRRQIAETEQRRYQAAEQAYADVVALARKLGPDGDWVKHLCHSTARSTVRDIGWQRIVQHPDAMHEPFIARFVGGPGHGVTAAAA